MPFKGIGKKGFVLQERIHNWPWDETIKYYVRRLEGINSLYPISLFPLLHFMLMIPDSKVALQVLASPWNISKPMKA
jgi:hypothetical protein